MKRQKFWIGLIVLLLPILAVLAYLFLHYYWWPRKFAQLQQRIIDRIISSLKPEQRLGQLLHIAIPGMELSAQSRKILEQIQPGGVILFGFNLGKPEQIQNLTRALQDFAQSRGLPPLLIATDQEGGYVKRVREGVLETPPAMDLGQHADPQLCFSAGYYVSRDLKKLGINLFYAPVLDINNNPLNPVIGLRSFGTTPDAVLGCALPFEQGARRAAAEREGGALPVIKHFPGHGDTEKDSHWDLPVVRKNLPILRSFELVPFRAAIQQGAVAVMTAHILYPEIDPNWPATLSPRWLQEILRGELGFRGTVFTDAMEMHAIAEHFASAKPPLQALLAGADVLLFTSWQDDPRQAILELQQALQPSQWATLRRALENQLRLKLSLIQPEHYLDKVEAEWYERYRWRNQENHQPLYSREKAQELLNGIRWSAPQKKKRVWLAGRKNRR